MKSKIFGALIGLTLGAVIIAAFFTIFIMYKTTARTLENGLHDELSYIKIALENDKNYLNTLPRDNRETRVTLIDSNGKVLFDSWGNPSDMDNHKSRVEITNAQIHGAGSATRVSQTLDKEIYYYAESMKDGRVIRLSRPTATVWAIVYSALPAILAGIIVLAMVAFWLAKRLTKKLIAPLDVIDLDHPIENDTYEELAPFLERIEKQRKDLRNDFEKLLAAENLRREFSANVSHELKTPLQSISGYAEIIGNGVAKSEDIPRFVEKIGSECARLTYMVDNILKISKLDEGKLALEKTAINLKDLSHKVVEQLSEKIKSKNIDLQELASDDAIVEGIPEVMEEVIFNLVENAIKYNKDGGKIVLSGGVRAGDVVYEVKDTGFGISKEALPRIFERFYREDKSHNNSVPGSGLGLAIVKHAVILQGGTIKVTSEVGQGTVFTITFEAFH